MSIWNKVLAWMVAVTAVAFFYLAGRTLETHAYWQKTQRNFEQAIEKVQRNNVNLEEGQPGQAGIRQVKLELASLLADRRRIWANCDPKVKADRQNNTAEVTVTIDKPDPHGIAENTVLYAFQDAEVQKRGRYLGEFKVTKVAGKDATLVPASALTTPELDRLAVAKGPWVLYNVVPHDSHEAFADVSDENKKAMLPAGVLEEYLKDGKPAGKDDPPDRVVDGKYVRPIRDYQVLFDNDVENRTVMDQRLKATQQDTNLLKDALAQAEKQQKACEADVAGAKEELTKIAGERTLVVDLSKAIQQKLEEVQSGISKLLEKNQAMAGRIAKQQLEAARRIDQRTRAMAQSGTRGR